MQQMREARLCKEEIGRGCWGSLIAVLMEGDARDTYEIKLARLITERE